MNSQKTIPLKMSSFLKTKLCCFLRIFVVTTLLYSTLIPSEILAQVGTLTGAPPTAGLNLPIPGTMVRLTDSFIPPMLKGLKIHPEDPLRFDFIVDTGNSKMAGEELKAEGQRLIKYFLASLTVPDDEIWVNLSPYEKDRIIPEKFGTTEMGRDLLAQDYVLKQLTASLIFPEEDLGKSFWEKIYKKAYDLYGTTNIPINTFNKVWIVPDHAVVYETVEGAFVGESHLKVMLEGDYLALSNNLNKEEIGTDKLEDKDVRQLSDVSSQIVKEVILPAIEKEVNEGRNFAQLRQIYQSLILATWYKQNLKKTFLGQVYVDKNKIVGVDVDDKEAKQEIYEQYVEAFKKGVYDYIKEDTDAYLNKTIKRRYVSGGFIHNPKAVEVKKISQRIWNALTKPVIGLAMLFSVSLVEPAFGQDKPALEEQQRSQPHLQPDSSRQDNLNRNDGGSYLDKGRGRVHGPHVVDEEIYDEVSIIENTQRKAATPSVEKSFQWVKSQVDSKTGLVKSFEGLPGGDPSNGKTWIYNQAQGILAALAQRDVKTAEILVNGLLQLKRKDGAWYNAYQTDSPTSRQVMNWEHNSRFVGANMAVGHALLEFMESNSSNEKLIQSTSQALLELARWLDNHYHDKGQYGYVNNGDLPGEQSYEAKTEYNLRAFAFYDRLSAITKSRTPQVDTHYKQRANKIINFVQKKMWNAKEQRYYTGLEYIPSEEIDEDPKEAIYPNYFAVIAAHISGRPIAEFSRGMKWVSEHKSTIKIQGQDIQGIARWLNTPSIWGKGTVEAAVAFELIGNHAEAEKLRKGLPYLQSGNGGVFEALSDDEGWNKMRWSWPIHFPFSSIEATSPFIIFLGNYDAKFIADFDIKPNNQIEESPLRFGVNDQNPYGGIDLDPTKIKLQIKRDGHGIPLPMDQQPPTLNIEGLFPFIINVVPVSVNQLPMILGMDNCQEGTTGGNVGNHQKDTKTNHDGVEKKKSLFQIFLNWFLILGRAKNIKNINDGIRKNGIIPLHHT